MGWAEHHDGAGATGEYTRSGPQRASTQRLFIVTTDVPPDVVVADPTAILGDTDGATPLPDYGSAHPRLTNLVLRTYSTSGEPPNMRVVAQYGLNDIDILNPEDPEFFTQSGDWFDEFDSIPNARKKNTLTNSNGQGPLQTIQLWDFETPPMEVLYTSRQHTMTVNVGGLIGNAIAAMDNQNNHLHLILGRYYRFKAGGYNEISHNVWTVNYQWFFDSGTEYDDSLAVFYGPTSPIAIPPFVTGGQGPSLDHPGAVAALGRTGAKYLRLPYHKRLIAPARSGVAADYPLFPHHLPYFRDPTGWQELVGLT